MEYVFPNLIFDNFDLMIAYLIDGRSHMQVQKEAKGAFIQLGIYFMTFFLDWNPLLPSSFKNESF